MWITTSPLEEAEVTLGIYVRFPAKSIQSISQSILQFEYTWNAFKDSELLKIHFESILTSLTFSLIIRVLKQYLKTPESKEMSLFQNNILVRSRKTIKEQRGPPPLISFSFKKSLIFSLRSDQMTKFMTIVSNFTTCFSVTSFVQNITTIITFTIAIIVLNFKQISLFICI